MDYKVTVEGRRTDLHQVAAARLAAGNTTVHDGLDIPLQPLAKVFEHGGTARQDNVLVQTSTDVDGRGLDDRVDDFGQGSEEIGRVDLGVEEDFRGEETLVANVQLVFLSSAQVDIWNKKAHSAGDAVFTLESCKVAIRIPVVFFELFDDILANIGVVLFDLLSTADQPWRRCIKEELALGAGLQGG